jgi:hypothetical protein
VDPSGFNAQAKLPFGLKPSHLESAMKDFIGFLSFVSNRCVNPTWPFAAGPSRLGGCESPTSRASARR